MYVGHCPQVLVPIAEFCKPISSCRLAYLDIRNAGGVHINSHCSLLFVRGPALRLHHLPVEALVLHPPHIALACKMLLRPVFQKHNLPMKVIKLFLRPSTFRLFRSMVHWATPPLDVVTGTAALHWC